MKEEGEEGETKKCYRPSQRHRGRHIIVIIMDALLYIYLFANILPSNLFLKNPNP